MSSSIGCQLNLVAPSFRRIAVWWTLCVEHRGPDSQRGCFLALDGFGGFPACDPAYHFSRRPANPPSMTLLQCRSQTWAATYRSPRKSRPTSALLSWVGNMASGNHIFLFRQPPMTPKPVGANGQVVVDAIVSGSTRASLAGLLALVFLFLRQAPY